ncbi:MAG TPA: hypothetical protein VG389_20545, partial [Myxococcota bacterium]|nr:hypothetical protein [Myxococcota bacterium]
MCAAAAALAAGAGCRPHGGGADGGPTDSGGLAACADGLDNDGDALIDFPADPGCVDGADGDETEPPQCSDGRDNDADGAVDLDDLGCTDPDDTSELNPECSDGIDNDGDGAVDYPQDVDCVSPVDEREAMDAACQDMRDNDDDMLFDFPADPGCDSATDVSESDVPDCLGSVPVTDVSRSGTMSGMTATADGSDFMGSCGGAGPEAVGFIDVPVPLTLLSVNTFGTTFDTAIYIETDCGNAASEVDCSTGPNPHVLELTGVAPGGYYLFADGTTASDAGNWFLHVFGIIAPGQACTPGDAVLRCDSTSGQICSEPIVGMGNVCNAGQCSDGFDNDGDAITDYPLDPGCIAPDDNTETDPPIVPQCYNGMDDDGDGFTDYPADPGCTATGDDLEIDDCIMGVPLMTLAPDGSAMGTTAGVSNFEGTCTASFTASGPEDVYVFTLGYTADVTVTTNLPGTTMDTGIYVRSVCDDTTTELACNDNDPTVPFTTASRIDLPGLGAGDYFVFVDGIGGVSGPYVLQVSGVFASGAPCDPTSMTFTCNPIIGDACQDTTGTGVFTCAPAQCANGTDDDGDSVVDYPAEPGCLTLADDDETNPVPAAVCSNGADDDGDAIVDYPSDPGCFFAADPTEEDQCIPGVPFIDLPPSGSYSGTISSFTGSFDGSCTFGFTPSAGEDVFIIPVPSASTVTFTTDLPGTFLDTGIYLRTVCDDTTSEIACNDNA